MLHKYQIFYIFYLWSIKYMSQNPIEWKKADGAVCIHFIIKYDDSPAEVKASGLI